MPVLELAKLHIITPSTPDSSQEIPPLLHSKLIKASQVLTSASKFPSQFFVSPTHRETLYILGAWTSVEEHRDVFIPSQANQELLEMLKEDVEVEWLRHISFVNGKEEEGERQVRKVLDVEKLFVRRFTREEGEGMGSFEQMTGKERELGPVVGVNAEHGEGRAEFYVFGDWEDQDEGKIEEIIEGVRLR